MRFIVSSTELLHCLLSGLRVIAKTTTPILDNFLFTLKGTSLEVTSSDSETVMKAVISVDEAIEEGSIAVPAKLLADSLKEFPEMPLEFSTLEDNNTLEIKWATGAQKIPFFSAEYYPLLPELSADAISIKIDADSLLAGLGYTLYATADEVLRPVMNGVLFDMSADSTSLVASDSHKLVCYTREDIQTENKASFILPKKPASILKSLLAKAEGDVTITFDGKNAHFEFGSYIVVGRLVDGTYPAYKTVIPRNNHNKMIIDRATLLNAAKRVSVCSNQATSSIKFSLSFNSLNISAQDTGFAISAHENLPCQYDGETMEIGFKSTFLIEILNNLPYEEICIELADPARAALLVAADQGAAVENICALLMPIRLAN